MGRSAFRGNVSNAHGLNITFGDTRKIQNWSRKSEATTHIFTTINIVKEINSTVLWDESINGFSSLVSESMTYLLKKCSIYVAITNKRSFLFDFKSYFLMILEIISINCLP